MLCIRTPCWGKEVKRQKPDIPRLISDTSGATVLVADDNLFFREVFKELLDEMGYEVITAENGAEALSEALRIEPDLVITDVVMPEMDGFEVTRRLKSDPRTMYTPVIVVTTLSDNDSKIKGLEAGADDFLNKPVDRTELCLRVRNLLKVKKYENYLIEQGRALESEMETRTLELQEAYEQIKHSYLETVSRLTLAAEYRDKETGAHIRRISLYSRLLAQKIGLSSDEVESTYRASPMHDVGKIGIPDNVLLKKGRFTESEYSVMKTHCEIGANILHNPGPVVLRTAMDIALNHHERWDGSGYPAGRKKTEIPVSGRIVHIVDMYDALRSRRPYKPAYDHERSLAIMEEQESYGFDPDIYKAFRGSASEFELIFASNQR